MGALQVKDQVSAGLFSLIWRLRGKGLRCVGFLGYRLIIDCQKAILGPDSLLLYRYTLNPNTHTHTHTFTARDAFRGGKASESQ